MLETDKVAWNVDAQAPTSLAATDSQGTQFGLAAMLFWMSLLVLAAQLFRWFARGFTSVSETLLERAGNGTERFGLHPGGLGLAQSRVLSSGRGCNGTAQVSLVRSVGIGLTSVSDSSSSTPKGDGQVRVREGSSTPDDFLCPSGVRSLSHCVGFQPHPFPHDQGHVAADTSPKGNRFMGQRHIPAQGLPVRGRLTRSAHPNWEGTTHNGMPTPMAAARSRSLESEDNSESLGASYQLHFIDGTGSKIDIRKGLENFDEEGYYCGENRVSHDQVLKALHADGSLVVAADFDFLVPDDGALQCDADLQQWPAKFSELHGDEASSDCSIQIGGTSISAHKSILAAHSPIFRSMFSHSESEEFQSGVVKITDFKEPEPMRAVIRYCYMGQLDTETMDGDKAVETFKLADRYCIAGLKALLGKHFADNRLSKENVVAMALFADTYSAPKLTEACIELIAEEGDAVFETADWKELRGTKPQFALDLAIAAYREK